MKFSECLSGNRIDLPSSAETLGHLPSGGLSRFAVF
jgi:hypothetical protein